MPRRPAHLPEFESPPITEVVMGIQFDPLTIGLSGLVSLWQENFKSRYPHIEEHPPLPSSLETFGKVPTPNQTFQLEFVQKPQVRFWFLNEQRTELLQIQDSKFIRNWRKVPNFDEYPRYESLRSRFAKDLSTFNRFIDRRKMDKHIDQCEISYTNVVSEQDLSGGDIHQKLGEILRGFDGHRQVAGCDLEGITVNLAWVDRTENGTAARLRADVVPIVQKSGKQAYMLTLSYRGTPTAASEKAILKFMDRGRDRIVSAFAEITTEGMHSLWQRRK